MTSSFVRKKLILKLPLHLFNSFFFKYKNTLTSWSIVFGVNSFLLNNCDKHKQIILKGTLNELASIEERKEAIVSEKGYSIQLFYLKVCLSDDRIYPFEKKKNTAYTTISASYLLFQMNWEIHLIASLFKKIVDFNSPIGNLSMSCKIIRLSTSPIKY